MDPGNMPVACAEMLLKSQYWSSTMIYYLYIWGDYKKYLIRTREHVPVSSLPGGVPSIECAGMLSRLQYWFPTIIYYVYIWANT